MTVRVVSCLFVETLAYPTILRIVYYMLRKIYKDIPHVLHNDIRALSDEKQVLKMKIKP